MYKKAQINLTNKTGHIYSVDTNGVVVNETTGHVMQGRIKNGYHLVCIQQKYIPIHRLVAFAFIPNEASKPYVNHIDGCKSNNNVDNLEWVTHRGDMTHARDTGLWVAAVGVEHGRCNVSEEDVHRICEYLEAKESWQTIKHKTNMTRNTYLNIRRRATWKHISSQYNF